MASQTPKQTTGFSPLLTQQFPGGSQILDQNLLRIKAAIGDVVDQFNRTVTFIGIGGGGGPGPFVPTTRRVNTTAPLAGGGSLAADLTLSLNIDGSLQVTGGLLGIGGRNPGQVQYGAASGGGLDQSSALVFSTALSQLQVSFTKAVGQNGLKLTNSSNAVTAFTDFALTNDLGDSFRADVYYTSSTYTGSDSAPSSLTFSTAAGSSSKVIFSPNNVKAMILTQSLVEFPVSDGTSRAIALTAATDQDIEKSGGRVFLGTVDAHDAGLYTNNVTRLLINATTGAVTLSSLGTGLVKATAGVLGLGFAGTDYEVPLTFSTGLTRSVNIITANLSTGISGGQSVIGGTGVGENLTIKSTTSGTKGAILIGNAASVGVLDENTGKQSWGNGGSIDAFAHFVLSNDTTPTTIASWDGRHVMLGASGSTGAGIGFSHTAGTGGNLLFISPGLTWERAGIYAQTLSLFTGGSNTLALTVDGTQVTSALGALQVNGVSAPSNTMLCVGHTTQSDRDRAQFFLGGGTLGATGTGDNTLFDLVPSGTNIRAGVTAGVYATQRIRGLTYTGVSSPTITEATSLYIDGPPTISGATGTPWALHVKSGGTFLEGLLEVTPTPGSGVPSLNVVASTGTYWLGDGGAGAGLLANNSTTGFIYVPMTAGGAPTGTPAGLAARSGATAMVYDPTGNVLYIWDTATSTWKPH